jgi:hypothetical protein
MACTVCTWIEELWGLVTIASMLLQELQNEGSQNVTSRKEWAKCVLVGTSCRGCAVIESG